MGSRNANPCVTNPADTRRGRPLGIRGPTSHCQWKIRKYVDFTIHPVLTISSLILRRRHAGDSEESRNADSPAIILIGSAADIERGCQLKLVSPNMYVQSFDCIKIILTYLFSLGAIPGRWLGHGIARITLKHYDLKGGWIFESKMKDFLLTVAQSIRFKLSRHRLWYFFDFEALRSSKDIPVMIIDGQKNLRKIIGI